MLFKKNFYKIEFLLIFISIILFFLIWFDISFYVKIGKILIYVLFLLFLALYASQIKKNKKVRRDNLIFIFSMIIVLYNSFFNSSNMGSIITFSILLLIFLSVRSVKLSEKEMKIIINLFIFYGLIWSRLTHEGYNPNSIGLVALFIVICISLFSTKNRFLQLIYVGVYIYILSYIIPFIFNSNSRGALYALFLFYILRFLIPSKILAKRFIYFGIILLFTIGSLIFVLVYVYMWENNITINLLFTEKNLFTGREEIWYELIYAFKNHPIIGIGSNYNLKSFHIMNSHNSMLNILVVYGFPVYLCITFFIINTLLMTRIAVLNDNVAKTAFCGIISILFNSFFETTFVIITCMPITAFLLCILFSKLNENYC